MKEKLLLPVLSALLMVANPVGAASIVVHSSSDTEGCDTLLTTTYWWDELGMSVGGFPLGERVTVGDSEVTLASACVATDNPLIDNILVTITNKQADIAGLFFVANVWNDGANHGTFSNSDGLINGSMAMMIDSIGDNLPLVYESGNADGIFEANETWKFIVQDWVSNLDPSFFATPGIVGASDNDTAPSLLVPEPSVFALSFLGFFLLLARRR